MRSAPLRSAPLRLVRRSAPLRLAPLRSAPLRSASLRFAPLRLAPLRLAPVRSALLRKAKTRLASRRSAPLRSAPLRSATLERSTSLELTVASSWSKLRSASLASLRSQPDRLTPGPRAVQSVEYGAVLSRATLSSELPPPHPVSSRAIANARRALPVSEVFVIAMLCSWSSLPALIMAVSLFHF